MCVGNEDRAKGCLSVCVSCPSLISAFPLSLFPPQTGFNYCPCSDLKPLWPLRTAPSPVLIAAQTGPPPQTHKPPLYSSVLFLCPFFFCPIESLCLFFQYYSLHFLLILPSACISSPNTSKLSPVYKCPQVVSVLLLNFQCCAMIKCE